MPGRPAAASFGPPGSGDTGTATCPTAASARTPTTTSSSRGGGRKWLKRSLYIALALAVVGGGLYGGYRWTQTQYYVGAKDEHVALYRGISQDLAWVSLSKVEKDHPEIELKYLPPYQRKQVEATIAEGSLDDARAKIDELADAGLRLQEGRASAARPRASRTPSTGEGEAGGPREPRPPPTSKATPTPTPSGPARTPTDQATTAPTPTPGPSLSEEEQKLATQCGKQ